MYTIHSVAKTGRRSALDAGTVLCRAWEQALALKEAGHSRIEVYSHISETTVLRIP